MDSAGRQIHVARGLLAGLVFVCALLPFARSVRSSLLDYDDQLYVIENAHMRQGLTVENIAWSFRSCGYAFNWHPLTWISLMADVTLCGGERDDVVWRQRDSRIGHFMHAHNIVLHGVNAVLFFLLLVRFRRRFAGGDGEEELPGLAFCGLCALVWALHPLRAEVVCWVAERKELLSVCFMLSSLLAYVGLVGGDVKGRGAWIGYAVSLVCFLLALLAKPVAVTLPTLLFALDWVYGGRMRLLRLAPFVLFSGVTCLLTMMAQTETLGTGATMVLPQRVHGIVGGPVVYLAQTFWPRGLSAFYRQHRDFDWRWLVPGFGLLAGFVAMGVAWLKTRRAVWGDCVVVIVWSYVGLLPMLGIIKVGTEEHSDRYTYWVGCGLSLALVLLWPRIKALAGRLEFGLTLKRLCMGLVCVVGVLGLMAYARSSVWRDTTTLFRDALPKCWQSGVALGLANTLAGNGGAGRAEGEAILRQTMAENPNADICGGLAAYLASGEIRTQLAGVFESDPFEEVRYLAARALSADPRNVLAYEALGLADAKSGKWADALKNYEKAQAVYPQKDYSGLLAECRERMAQGGGRR